MPDGVSLFGDKLNASQQKAEAEIEESIRLGRQHLLTGDAGYGKTRLMQVIAAKDRGWKDMVLTAPTHQACGVLRLKMEAAGANVSVITTHALLGLKPVYHGTKLRFERDPHAEPVSADIIGVDETSMLGGELTDLLNRWTHGRPVIFSGDQGQLFPVGEGESPTFQVPHHSHLDEPIRQALGNPILEAAWAIRACQQRDRMDWSWVKPAHNKPHGVYVPDNPDAWLKKAFTSSDFNWDSMTFRMLCWTNARVAELNQRIRYWRYGETPGPFIEGERALIRSPVIKKRQIVLHTNEEVTVKQIKPGNRRGVRTWDLCVEDNNDGPHELQIAADPNALQAKLAEMADSCRSGRKDWKSFYTLKDGFVSIQPIYALTVHNSQGITTRNSFLDLPEMRRWVRQNHAEGSRGLYVAATRSTHGLFLIA